MRRLQVGGVCGVVSRNHGVSGDVMPEAESVLDAGWERFFGPDAARQWQGSWGFDHSPWAMEHAEESAKPFLRKASVDDVHYDQPIDMLLAFSLFECLTEEQAFAFSRRALRWTRHGLLAVIALADEQKQEAGADDGDLSRISLAAGPGGMICSFARAGGRMHCTGQWSAIPSSTAFRPEWDGQCLCIRRAEPCPGDAHHGRQCLL